MKSTLIATIAAGMLAPAGLSPAQHDRPAGEDPKPTFVPCDTILDARIAGRTEPIHPADLEDLVMDARNGRVVYAIIDTSGLMQSSGSSIALPYGALSWDSGSRQFIVDATRRQLEAVPPCDLTNLALLADESRQVALRDIFGDLPELRAAESGRGDEYTGCFGQRPETIEGTITAINPEARTAYDSACCAVVVGDAGGAQYTVFLAPMTHLTRQSLVPNEGDAISAVAVRAYDGDLKAVHVAKSVRLDGRSLRLRDNDGVPAWTSSGEDARSAPTFYVLAGHMHKGSMYAQGEKFGRIDDVVFEVHSGTAAFAVISVGGVLGVDDTLYPIPWGAFAPGADHDLLIDTPVSTLRLAPKLSEEGIDDHPRGVRRARV